MMFGGFKHTVDKKGRIFIPAKFRDELGESFVISRGVYGKTCLCVYPNDEWEKFVSKFDALPSIEASKIKRFLFDGTFTVEFDSQGRILIPPSLREYAGLNDDARIIGMQNSLEIWNTELWEKENAEYTPESVSSVISAYNI